MEYESIIGFEVHAQLSTESKIFCSCRNASGGAANTRVCPVCLGMPGVLPVLNGQAVEAAVRVALALNASVPERSSFARKSYFYPDLPKGYQITQYSEPLALGGHLDIGVDGSSKRVRILRIHIEEDAGKTIHDTVDGRSVSLVDMNRCGVPLVEIVTHPDLRSPDEAHAFLTKLHQVLVFLGITSGSMHEGAMRFDTNISLKPLGQEEAGVKTEIKNLNSFKAARKALASERERQRAILASGARVAHETLLWDEAGQRALPMRSKEVASDYRYFPEPDLPCVSVDRDWLDRVGNSMPELPDDMRRRFRSVYGIPEYDSEVLTTDPETSVVYEATVRKLLRALRPDLEIAEVEVRALDGLGGPRAGSTIRERALPGGIEELPRVAKIASNWLMVIVGGLLNARGISIGELASSVAAGRGRERLHALAARLAEIILPRYRGEINEPAAKELFDAAIESSEPVCDLIARLGLAQLSDEATIAEVVARVLAAEPVMVERYKVGERKLFGHFMGQIMKETEGRVDPKLASEILERRLTA